MKKLVLMFVAIVAVSFASCGNKAAQVEEQADSTAMDTTEVVDTTANDTTVAE
jgi:hypothetical protein